MKGLKKAVSQSVEIHGWYNEFIYDGQEDKVYHKLMSENSWTIPGPGCIRVARVGRPTMRELYELIMDEFLPWWDRED